MRTCTLSRKTTRLRCTGSGFTKGGLKADNCPNVSLRLSKLSKNSKHILPSKPVLQSEKSYISALAAPCGAFFSEEGPTVLKGRLPTTRRKLAKNPSIFWVPSTLSTMSASGASTGKFVRAKPTTPEPPQSSAASNRAFQRQRLVACRLFRTPQSSGTFRARRIQQSLRERLVAFRLFRSRSRALEPFRTRRIQQSLPKSV